jgi:hypothetical protein
MKKIVFPILLAVLALATVSCEKTDKKKKWDKEKTKADYYYSEDFKQAEGTILDLDISEIDYLYSVFFYEGKDLRYKLVAEQASNETCGEECEKECTKVLAYEQGSAEVDDNLSISFIPDADPMNTYSGQFENEKKSYTVSLPGLSARDLNFIIKE